MYKHHTINYSEHRQQVQTTHHLQERGQSLEEEEVVEPLVQLLAVEVVVEVEEVEVQMQIQETRLVFWQVNFLLNLLQGL